MNSNLRLLRITLLAGIILLFLSGIVLTFIILNERSASQLSRQQDSFSRMLREYDSALGQFFGTEREYDYLNRELDRLERNAIGVESWLSVLKRRRALSLQHRPSRAHYIRSINNALSAYPASEPIAAIAAAAFVKDSAITNETGLQLRRLLAAINDSSFNTFRLSMYILLGDFRNPQSAVSIPVNIVSDGTETVSVSMALLKILRGDYRGATADIQTLLYSFPSNDTLRFAGEYYYDFGDIIRSAEIFSLINDDAANIRQADALYLAGYRESAKTIWSILADFNNETSLYNLAVLAQEQEQVIEAAAFLETLVNINPILNPDRSQFGLIRHSRLLDLRQAVTALQTNENFPPVNFPFIDLEINKRQTQDRTLGRQIAETWMLLDRHPDKEEIYEWAAWHLFFQRRFDETHILLDRFDRLPFTSQWTDIYRALQLMVDGKIDAAESILLAIPVDKASWTVHANLGRIHEERLSASRAVMQYEQAAQKAENNQIAARIHVRIARCYSSLGQNNEARRALLNALELDPDNLTARLELERFF